MSIAAASAKPVPWWKEPTKDQWLAWLAAWLGRTLDAFDFTVLLLIMLPISRAFDVPLTMVAFVFTITLWLRLVGALASGWLADRIGRKTLLMISILLYSLANFIAGFSPSFLFLAVLRALLGIGMGAEWTAGSTMTARPAARQQKALAKEGAPTGRSRSVIPAAPARDLQAGAIQVCPRPDLLGIGLGIGPLSLPMFQWPLFGPVEPVWSARMGGDFPPDRAARRCGGE